MLSALRCSLPDALQLLRSLTMFVGHKSVVCRKRRCRLLVVLVVRSKRRLVAGRVRQDIRG